VEIHLDVAHAGDDEHRHLRNLPASALRLGETVFWGADEAESGTARRLILLGFLQSKRQTKEEARRCPAGRKQSIPGGRGGGWPEGGGGRGRGDICDCASLKHGFRSFAIMQFGFANLPCSDIAILLQCLFTIVLLILGFSPPDLTKMPLRALAVDLVRLRCLAAMTVRPNQ
jgi:hypothetical protein